MIGTAIFNPMWIDDGRTVWVWRTKHLSGARQCQSFWLNLRIGAVGMGVYEYQKDLESCQMFGTVWCAKF